MNQEEHLKKEIETTLKPLIKNIIKETLKQMPENLVNLQNLKHDFIINIIKNDQDQYYQKKDPQVQEDYLQDFNSEEIYNIFQDKLKYIKHWLFKFIQYYFLKSLTSNLKIPQPSCFAQMETKSNYVQNDRMENRVIKINFRAGDAVIKENQINEYTFLVSEGLLDYYDNFQSEEENYYGHINQGEMFGQDNKYTVITNSDCVLWKIHSLEAIINK